MATPDSPETGLAGDSTAAGSALPGHTVPGHSVDALRAQGKPAEARVEFERLIQEGMDSGVDPRPPASIFDSVRAEILSRSTPQADDTAGAQG